MKYYLFLAAFAAIMVGCDDNATSDHSGHDSVSKKAPSAVEVNENVRQLKPSLADLDKNVSSHINGVFEHYIHIKTALVNTNPTEARNGANAILRVLKDFDKSLLPTEQKAVYDKPMADFKTAANGIAATDDINKQREHFASLSNSAYELAKSFGGGKTLYHDHCPMAFDQRGAMWLSESREVQNPYYGEKMLKCGTVEEVIEN